MAQVKRFGEDARAFRSEILVLHRDGSEPRNKHDSYARLSRRDTPRQLDPVDSGHDHIRDQQIVIGVVRLHQCRFAIGHRIDRMPGPPQTTAEKSAQLIVVFGEKDSRHSLQTSRAKRLLLLPLELTRGSIRRKAGAGSSPPGR